MFLPVVFPIIKTVYCYFFAETGYGIESIPDVNLLALDVPVLAARGHSFGFIQCRNEIQSKNTNTIGWNPIIHSQNVHRVILEDLSDEGKRREERENNQTLY
jgi:hypothetical protein